MNLEKEDEGMYENIRVRMFTTMKERIEEAQKVIPNRWENNSHFIRAAIANFLNHLEKEEGLIFRGEVE